MADESTLQVAIWRGGEDGQLVEYQVPFRANQTVLDVVTWVQRSADADLAYRFACRVGMCGSCAMTVNGKPMWTCRTHVKTVADAKGRIEIRPLSNLPVIKDLVTDMAPFFEKWRRAEGHFRGTTDRTQPMARISPQSRRRRAADRAIECINCAVCHAACDLIAWNPDYLGPAALNRAWSLINDERDGARTPRLAAVAQADGCHNCHSHQACAEACPKQLNPTAGIAGLKRATLATWLKRELVP